MKYKSVLFLSALFIWSNAVMAGQVCKHVQVDEELLCSSVEIDDEGNEIDTTSCIYVPIYKKICVPKCEQRPTVDRSWSGLEFEEIEVRSYYDVLSPDLTELICVIQSREEASIDLERRVSRLKAACEDLNGTAYESNINYLRENGFVSRVVSCEIPPVDIDYGNDEIYDSFESVQEEVVIDEQLSDE